MPRNPSTNFPNAPGPTMLIIVVIERAAKFNPNLTQNVFGRSPS